MVAASGIPGVEGPLVINGGPSVRQSGRHATTDGILACYGPSSRVRNEESSSSATERNGAESSSSATERNGIVFKCNGTERNGIVFKCNGTERNGRKRSACYGRSSSRATTDGKDS